MSENDAAKSAQEAFFHELKATEGRSVPSVEQRAVDHETDRDAEAAARARLETLRASFLAAGDDVNLLWLEYRLQGETDLQTMAERSGRDVTEFYRAADRRKRHTRRLLAAERGVRYEEGE